jgi:hypothetical protein
MWNKKWSDRTLHTRAVCKVRGLTLLLESELCEGAVTVSFFFEVPPLVSDALLENPLQTVCRKLQEDSGTGGFDLGAPFSWLGKPRNRMGARSGLYGGCSDGAPPISVSASIATFQLGNADAPLKLLYHPNVDSFKRTVTQFSRNGWSVVRSPSLAKRGTSKKRPSPHLHKVPTRSNKVSPRTLQTADVCLFSFVLQLASFQEKENSLYREYTWNIKMAII